MIQTLLAWLKTYPGWEQEWLWVDRTDPAPGNIGLYPTGMRELSRREDVLGSVTVRNRQSFTLCRVTAGQTDGWASAQWIAGLQEWVQSQSLRGLAPVFGDSPGTERILAQAGRLQSACNAGTVKYTVSLTVEYEKTIQKKGE